MSGRWDDRSLEQLLGAYALNSLDPDEAAGVEGLLKHRPDLAHEVARLTEAAAWLGALEAHEPPATLRDTVLGTIAVDVGAAAALYEAEARRLADELDRLDPADHDVITHNGLSARSLVVHIAAQETLLARAVGWPVDDLEIQDVEARTAALVERYGHSPYPDVLGLWRRAVQAVEAWANHTPSPRHAVAWLGLPTEPADALIGRAFENWVHRDDLRRVRGAASDPPPAPELGLMAALAMRILSAGLSVTGHSRPGRTARMVLTGPGGGTWHVPLDPADEPGEPDITLTTSAIDWCRLAAERLDPADVAIYVDGDPAIADELLAAASAFATL